MKVAVIRTGTANLASAVAGLQRAGVQAELTSDPDVVRQAQAVMLPGVGAFAAAMAELRQTGLDAAITERFLANRPLLCICLGLQVLANSSEESPGTPGLGVIDAAVTRFTGAVRVPQLGWNTVEPTAEARLLHPGYAYFANSFKLDAIPDGYHGAWAEHGTRFVAAIERGPVLACQFHPELSGDWGQALLARWLGTTC